MFDVLGWVLLYSFALTASLWTAMYFKLLSYYKVNTIFTFRCNTLH